MKFAAWLLCAAALAAPLACHRCGSAMKNMPTLRAHLEEHERGTK